MTGITKTSRLACTSLLALLATIGFGNAALALKGGRIALAASGSQVRTLPLDDETAATLRPPPSRSRSRRRRRAQSEPTGNAPSSSE